MYGNNQVNSHLLVSFPSDILENSARKKIEDKWSRCHVGAEVARTALTVFIGAGFVLASCLFVLRNIGAYDTSRAYKA